MIDTCQIGYYMWKIGINLINDVYLTHGSIAGLVGCVTNSKLFFPFLH